MLSVDSNPGWGTGILQAKYRREKKKKKKAEALIGGRWSEDNLLQSLRDNLQNAHHRVRGTPGGAIQKALVYNSRKQAHLLVA